MGAHLLWEQGGGGSNPLIPTRLTGSGLVAKARVSGTREPGFESLLPDQVIAGEWNGQPREPHKLEDNGFDSRARYQICPCRLTAGFLILSQETRIRLPPRVRSVRGVRSSSVPCHGTDHGFKSRTDRQILWPVRLSVRMADFQSVEAGSTPAQATKGALCESLTTFRCGEPRLTKAP